MRMKAVHAARILLGLVFFIFGLNGFLHFLPQPPFSGPPADFLAAMIRTGYLFPLLKGTEVAGGALLLSGRFVPLALTLLAPVIVNILGFHVFLAPFGLGIPLLILVLELFLARSYASAFRPLLRQYARPDRASDGDAVRAAHAGA